MWLPIECWGGLTFDQTEEPFQGVTLGFGNLFWLFSVILYTKQWIHHSPQLFTMFLEHAHGVKDGLQLPWTMNYWAQPTLQVSKSAVL